MRHTQALKTSLDVNAPSTEVHEHRGTEPPEARVKEGHHKGWQQTHHIRMAEAHKQHFPKLEWLEQGNESYPF